MKKLILIASISLLLTGCQGMNFCGGNGGPTMDDGPSHRRCQDD